MRVALKLAAALMVALPMAVAPGMGGFAFAQTPRTATPAHPPATTPNSAPTPAHGATTHTQAATPAATPAAAPAARPAAAGAKVDVNSATEAQLDALPGIGPVRSKAIVAGRPYVDLADLVTKKILTQGVLDGAKSRMALANINTSSAADMAKTLPGIGDVRSKAIVAGRPYATPDDLVKKGVLTQGVFDKMKDVAAF